MWKALELADIPVKEGGLLFVAIYNDQGVISKIWRSFKARYNQSGQIMKKILLASMILYFELRGMIGRAIKGKNPFSFKHWVDYKKQRGMSMMHDYVDWAGGYPFETAKPEEIFDFYKNKGYTLEKIYTCGGGLGCNQFLFKKRSAHD